MIVHELAGSRAVIECVDPQLEELLISMGFEYKDGFYVKQIDAEEKRMDIIKTLMEKQALFAEGRDWSPAELMLYYQAQGIVGGKIRTISWTNPNEYNISEK
jgi:hypothetical protein